MDCTVQNAQYRLHITDCTVQTAQHRLHSTDCTSQTAQYRLHITDCTVQTAQHWLHSTYCVHIAQCRLHSTTLKSKYSISQSLYQAIYIGLAHTAQYRLHITDCTVQAAHHRLHSTDCTSQTAQYRLHITDCTVQTAQYRLHITDCTIQTADYTLHSTDCTIQRENQKYPISQSLYQAIYIRLVSEQAQQLGMLTQCCFNAKPASGQWYSIKC